MQAVWQVPGLKLLAKPPSALTQRPEVHCALEVHGDALPSVFEQVFSRGTPAPASVDRQKPSVEVPLAQTTVPASQFAPAIA